MKIKKIIISILFLIIFICIGNSSYATTIEFSKSDPEVGDDITIKVTVQNVHTVTVFANVEGAGISKQQIEVVGGDMMGNKQTFSNSITVKPTEVGTIKVSVTDDSRAIADGQDVNVAASEFVSVSEPPSTPTDPGPTTPTTPTQPTTPTLSSNAILSDLGIKPHDFSGFSKNPTKEDWYATVPNDVTSVNVYAKPGEGGTILSGTGTKTLVEGKNKLTVTVRSADQSKTKVYIIWVTREVAEGEITPNTDENVADTTSNEILIGLGKLEITGMTLSPEFSTNEYKYTVEGIIDNIKTLSDFKELITAEANFEGASIEVTSDDEEFKVGRNKIIITVKDTDGREIAIYNIVLKLKSSDTAAGIIEIEEEDEEKEKINIGKILLIIIIPVIIIYSIIITIIVYKQRKILEVNGLIKKEDDYEEFDWDNKIEDNKVEINSEENEEKKKNLDEFLGQRVSEFEADGKDFETKKSRGGKRFQ